MREIILDTETTGLAFKDGHRIIEIACLELIDQQKTGKIFQKYINPERKCDEEALSVHGITDAFLADKPKFREIIRELIEFLQDSPIIAHNASFDIGFINNELALANRKPLTNQIIDSLTLAKKKFPGMQNNLDMVCKRLGISTAHRNLHGALLDAELLAEAYLDLIFDKQASLLIKAINPEPNSYAPQERPFLPPRTFLIPEDEYELHKKVFHTGLYLWNWQDSIENEEIVPFLRMLKLNMLIPAFTDNDFTQFKSVMEHVIAGNRPENLVMFIILQLAAINDRADILLFMKENSWAEVKNSNPKKYKSVIDEPLVAIIKNMAEKHKSNNVIECLGKLNIEFP